jgi:RNA-directed DNA polymerase
VIDESLETPDKVRDLQIKLYRKAKNEPEFRFYQLYDKVYREDVLLRAWTLAKANHGARGVDEVSFEDIESGGPQGVMEWLHGLGKELLTTGTAPLSDLSWITVDTTVCGRMLRTMVTTNKTDHASSPLVKTYKPQPVRRVTIEKQGGGERPLGIPTIRDRVAQTAAKLILEPIFEADLEPCAYGYRPKRSAQDAVQEVNELLHQGYTDVVDADLSKYRPGAQPQRRSCPGITVDTTVCGRMLRTMVTTNKAWPLFFAWPNHSAL